MIEKIRQSGALGPYCDLPFNLLRFQIGFMYLRLLTSSRGAPIQLFEQILEQKEMCNEMLQSKNHLIEMLEAENRVCDEKYKELIHSYHVNMSVLAGRMENHVQVVMILKHLKASHF